MRIERLTHGDMTVLSIVGDIAEGTGTQLMASLETALGEGADRIIVDVHAVEYIDSGGFSVLHRITQRLVGRGRLCLVGASADLERMFRIVGLTSQPHFVLYADLEEARREAGLEAGSELNLSGGPTATNDEAPAESTERAG